MEWARAKAVLWYNQTVLEAGSFDESGDVMDATILKSDYGVADELTPFIDSGFLLPLTPKPEEKTATFDIPSLQYDDENGNEYFFTLTWIHPDFNKEFCHFYDETPGDLPNFFIEKETRNGRSEQVEDLESLDDLVAWLEEKKAMK